MSNIIDEELSLELQELYLKNKEWQSAILFMEDELRFFKMLISSKQTAILEIKSGEKAILIYRSLVGLEQNMLALKTLNMNHKKLIGSLLTTKDPQIGLNLIEEHSAIGKELGHLFAAEKLLKMELFALIENVI